MLYTVSLAEEMSVRKTVTAMALRNAPKWQWLLANKSLRTEVQSVGILVAHCHASKESYADKNPPFSRIIVGLPSPGRRQADP